MSCVAACVRGMCVCVCVRGVRGVCTRALSSNGHLNSHANTLHLMLLRCVGLGTPDFDALLVAALAA